MKLTLLKDVPRIGKEGEEVKLKKRKAKELIKQGVAKPKNPKKA